MQLFLNHLNSTNNLVVDVPVCTPSKRHLSNTAPIELSTWVSLLLHPRRPEALFMSVDCSSLGLTRLPRLLFSTATEKYCTVDTILVPVPTLFGTDYTKRFTFFNCNPLPYGFSDPILCVETKPFCLIFLFNF
ncbi:hypothetical protein CEXT_171081 [Caerostris extrusa]|uniref:Uncharacterized protein n=1 Tax=Caerostris extrusa TaxID=172846 RepID=A0AAV4XT46_CAEEX|nr:hypothetical protein CEXT_171081 [Caerostris extrusa]